MDSSALARHITILLQEHSSKIPTLPQQWVEKVVVDRYEETLLLAKLEKERAAAGEQVEIFSDVALQVERVLAESLRILQIVLDFNDEDREALSTSNPLRSLITLYRRHKEWISLGYVKDDEFKQRELCFVTELQQLSQFWEQIGYY